MPDGGPARHRHRRLEKFAGTGRTLRADAMRRLRKNKLAVAGLIWIIIVILVAVTADLWAPSGSAIPPRSTPTTVAEQTLLPPSADHPFGTDKLGRDIVSRMVYGARVSLIVGVVAVVIMVVIGLITGGARRVLRGLWDSIIMRTADVFFAFPYILFAIVLIAILGRGFRTSSSPSACWAGRASPGSSEAPSSR